MRDVTKQLIISAVAAMLFGKDLVSGSVYGFEWDKTRDCEGNHWVVRDPSLRQRHYGARFELPHSSM